MLTEKDKRKMKLGAFMDQTWNYLCIKPTMQWDTPWGSRPPPFSVSPTAAFPHASWSNSLLMHNEQTVISSMITQCKTWFIYIYLTKKGTSQQLQKISWELTTQCRASSLTRRHSNGKTADCIFVVSRMDWIAPEVVTRSTRWVKSLGTEKWLKKSPCCETILS